MRVLVAASVIALGCLAQAENKVVFSGSDTLAGAVSDAIITAGLDARIQYLGGGSGVGEKGLVSGDQGIAPMSREIKPEAKDALKAKGVEVVEHVLALDGIAIFVKSNNPAKSVDLPTLVRIFTCEYTKWEQIPGSGQRGEIKAFRRNDQSGTTDAFKHFTGVKQFGACVKVVNETADISDATGRDVFAIGYSGLSGKTSLNKALSIAPSAGARAVQPTTATVRNFTYPLARKLFVYEVKGARAPNESEQLLLDVMTDRSFMDPIMQQHEFITLN